MSSNKPTMPVTDKPVMPLWPNGPPDAVGNEPEDCPELTVFAATGAPLGTGIIVLPGGGYSKLAIGHEGMEVVEWLNAHGITAFLLKYRHGPRYQHPTPLQDAQRAVRIVRSRAHEWNVDPGRIGMLGFSAGGHLAASAAIYHERGNVFTRDPLNRVSSRPDYLVLIYPVITLIRPNSIRGSMSSLLGEEPPMGLLEALSLDLHVDRNTPPAFLVHTTADRSVSAENSVLFYLALLKHKVPAELHIYEQGKHGRGLGPPELSFSTWPNLCLRWLCARGIIPELEAQPSTPVQPAP